MSGRRVSIDVLEVHGMSEKDAGRFRRALESELRTGLVAVDPGGPRSTPSVRLSPARGGSPEAMGRDVARRLLTSMGTNRGGDDGV